MLSVLLEFLLVNKSCILTELAHSALQGIVRSNRLDFILSSGSFLFLHFCCAYKTLVVVPCLPSSFKAVSDFVFVFSFCEYSQDLKNKNNHIMTLSIATRSLLDMLMGSSALGFVNHGSKKGPLTASHDFEPPRLNNAPLPVLMQPHQ
jgi:hypothetical protein